jgi:N-acylneuraminate cytidylyltransferase
VFSATETFGFLWHRDADRPADGVNHDPGLRPRRQDREPHFLETGAFYVMDAAGFRTAAHRFFGRIGFVEVEESSAIEIDTLEQLELAKAIAPLVLAPWLGRSVDVDAVVTDFDGVHTDDTVLVDAAGTEVVKVSRSDGMGVSRLRAAGIPVLILSTEKNPVVAARARKLRVDVRQAVDDKAAVLREWASDHGIPLERIAYLGNDVNDLGCLEIIGWPVAVPEAHPLVLAAARVILARSGGAGAVRDLADRVLRARERETLSSAAAGGSSRTEPKGLS